MIVLSILIFIAALVLLCKVSALSTEIEALRARIVRLENKASPAVEPPKMSAKAPLPAAPPVLKPQVVAVPPKAVATSAVTPVSVKPASGFNFEKVFMENIFSKLGALALIVGVAIFIKLISPFVVFTPLKQIISAYLLGAAMMIFSWRIHKKQMRGYAELLMGTGFAIFFIATYGATSFYHMMPDWLAMAVGSFLVLMSYAVSQRYKTFSTMLVGMIAAYLNPLIIGYHQAIEFLYIYFVYINMITAVYTFVNQSKISLNYANILLTSLCLYVYSHFTTPVPFLFPAFLWAVYLIYDIVALCKLREYKPINRGQSILNYLVLLFFSYSIFAVTQPLLMGLILCIVALIYGLFSYYVRGSATLHSLFYRTGALTAFAFAAYYIPQDTLRICVWALQGLACAALWRATPLAQLEKWVVGLILCSFTAALLLMSYGGEGSPFWNLRTIQLGLPCLCSLACALLIQSRAALLGSFLKFMALIAAFLYLSIELHSLLAKSSALSSFEEYLIYTLIGFLFVPIALYLYLQEQYKLFGISAAMAYLGSLLSLLLLSFASVNYPVLFPFCNIEFLLYAIAFVVTLIFRRVLISKGWLLAQDILKFTALALLYCIAYQEMHRLLGLCELQDAVSVYAYNLMLAISYALVALWVHYRAPSSLFQFASYGVYMISLSSLLFMPCFELGAYHPKFLFNIVNLVFLLAMGASATMAYMSSRQQKKASSYVFCFMAITLAYWNISIRELDLGISFFHLNVGMQAYEVLHIVLGLCYLSALMYLYRRSQYKVFALLAYLGYGFCIFYFLVDSLRVYMGFNHLWPLLNVGSIAYLAAFAAGLYMSRGPRKNFFSYLLIFLGMCYVGTESLRLGADFSRQAQEVTLSSAWILYSFVLMGLGIFKDKKILKSTGIGIIIFSAFKIVLYDLSKIDALSKTIAFLLLGAVLLSISYYYTKKMNK